MKESQEKPNLWTLEPPLFVFPLGFNKNHQGEEVRKREREMDEVGVDFLFKKASLQVLEEDSWQALIFREEDDVGEKREMRKWRDLWRDVGFSCS